jgi:hypothetical protein
VNIKKTIEIYTENLEYTDFPSDVFDSISDDTRIPAMFMLVTFVTSLNSEQKVMSHTKDNKKVNLVCRNNDDIQAAVKLLHSTTKKYRFYVKVGHSKDSIRLNICN